MPAASSKTLLRALGLALISSEIWPCRTNAGECAPVDASAKSIWTSFARESLPLVLYAEPTSRVILRIISKTS